MKEITINRRHFVVKALAAGGGLVAAAAVPASWAEAAAGHMPGCGAPFGPLHRYLYATSPAPYWADQIVWRESNWVPSAYNRSSGAAGLAQFIPSTWAWGQERFGIYGSPFDPYANLDMMAAFLTVGEFYHWNLGSPARLGR